MRAHATEPSTTIAALPEPLRDGVTRHWEALREAAAAEDLRLPQDEAFGTSFARVWAASEFVARSCSREPRMLVGLIESGDLARPYGAGELPARIQGELAAAPAAGGLEVALRRVRRREMVRIAWRDLAGWAPLEETLGELTDLAEACLEAALRRLDAAQREKVGSPRSRGGEPQSLVVIGMGKLGARELNFSSDIDLIFAYPEEGQTDGARPLSNEEYFARLGRALIQALNTTTSEGFVFRVDMRLRPYGDSGPLAMSFDAMEDYYQVQGREWERYAMIKARPVAGERAAGERLLRRLRPFVYRRYLDYSAFESLRDMKALISREVRRKGLEANIKLGPGGIREIEFIGQAFQLIRGGREPEMQERGILAVLRQLGAKRHLPGYVTRGLSDAYVFLRRVENRLQAHADRQTHVLPTGDRERLALAHAMGAADWVAFTRELERHRRLVQEHFEQVFRAPQADDGAGAQDLHSVWRDSLEDAQAEVILAEAGFEDPSEALRLLTQLRDSQASRASRRGRERLDRLMPLLLGAAGRADHPTATLLRSVRVIEAIAGRSAYVALLVENPMALSQLVKLCAASPWIAGLLARHPALLDELLDPRTLYTPLGRERLEQELRGQLGQVPPDDLEQQMEVLRHFRQSNVLRVAAADVAEVMPLMVVSDHLTEIAEVVLGQVLELAWQHLVRRYGRPRCRMEGQVHEPGFAIVAYGKLGGIELGYGSDLDLVFLHDSDGEEQATDGPKPVDNAVFFARLGQRIIHILSTQTPAGVLYEVDTRLRPSGASGLLVSSLAAFAEYQRAEAWTWEHQALVRARVVAGEPRLAHAFEGLRREVLSRPRDPEVLRREVREMRERMRAELGSRGTGWFDIKQDRGGIADIEFMVQYGVLSWAHGHPELLRYTDNIRQLEGLSQAGLMSAEEAGLLADAYRAFRAGIHRLTLQNEPARVTDAEFAEYRDAVARLWRERMEDR
jgi:[glutamine synthetase] adenylyltransferase / [glutamine synthetase]-adenylyl-L-tyrosine phosphorylase